MPYLIRRTTPADADALHTIFTSPGVVPGTLQRPFKSRAETRQAVANTPDHLHALVATTASGEVIGNAGLRLETSQRRRHSATLFLLIRDDWQGKGVGSQLMKAVIDLADNWLGLKRLELSVMPENHHAQALYEKFGFVREGMAQREALRFGRHEHTVLMARYRFAPGELANNAANLGTALTTTKPRADGSYRLRSAEPSDAAAFAANMAFESVYANTLQLPYPSPALWEKRLADVANGYRVMIVAAQDNGEVIGSCSAWQSSPNPRLAHSASIGITIVPAWQGCGVGSALMQALVTELTHWHPYRRLELHVYADNAPAIALYRKFGFAEEALLKGRGFRHGQYHDTLQMSLWLNQDES